MEVQQREYKIALKTSDLSLLVSLFGKELPDKNCECVFTPDVKIKAEHVEVQHGFIETSIIVNCVLQIAAGVAVKVVGDLLVDRLKGKKAELDLNNRQIAQLTASQIVSALNGVKDVEE